MKRLKYLFSMIGLLLLFCGLISVMAEMIVVQRYSKVDCDNLICQFFYQNMFHEALPRAIKWEILYPLSDSKDEKNGEKSSSSQDSLLDKYLKMVNKSKQSFQDYSTKYLPIYYECTVAKNIYGKFLGWDIGIEKKDIFKLNNGYYSFCVDEVNNNDLNEIGQSIYEFDIFLKSKSIPFLYVNAAGKVPPGYFSGYKESVYFGNKNVDGLLYYLESRKVACLDTREYLYSEPIENNYFKYDHHWKPNAALKMAPLILQRLGMRESFNYYPVSIGNAFEGSIGRKLEIGYSQRENIEYLIPYDSSHYRMEIPNEDYYKTGSYEDVFIERELIKKILSYDEVDYIFKPDAYSIIRIRNDAYVRLENFNAHNNVKVLMLYDSFSWYLATYLLKGVKQIDMIYRPNFHGSIKTFVEKEHPDVVLMVISQDNIEKIDWSIGVNHRSGAFFDLR